MFVRKRENKRAFLIECSVITFTLYFLLLDGKICVLYRCGIEKVDIHILFINIVNYNKNKVYTAVMVCRVLIRYAEVDKNPHVDIKFTMLS